MKISWVAQPTCKSSLLPSSSLYLPRCSDRRRMRLTVLINIVILIDYSITMNLKDLKYLVALADTGHFGKAAERTFVSQPTLSAQLKKLEEYLGVKLVERQPNNVQLTDVGKEVVVRARRMLGESEEIIALARNSTDPLAGKLRMALIPTIGPYLLPRVMQKIRKTLPNLSLMLYEHQTEPLLKAAARR
jgi:LysR family hydrogen peroxide-inducible transcriptional activator